MEETIRFVYGFFGTVLAIAGLIGLLLLAALFAPVLLALGPLWLFGCVAVVLLVLFAAWYLFCLMRREP